MRNDENLQILKSLLPSCQEAMHRVEALLMKLTSHPDMHKHSMTQLLRVNLRVDLKVLRERLENLLQQLWSINHL